MEENNNNVEANEEVKQEANETLTQDQVNDIVKKRVFKERQKVENELKNNDDYKAYLEWRDNQKSEIEKQNEKMQALNSENESYKKELSYLKNKELVIKAGVNAKFLNYVTYEVSNSTDEKKPFNEALTEFLESNKEFLNDSSNLVSTGLKQGGPTKKLDGVEAAFYKLNPKLKK